jgi:uncharacterized SAM-binding protein YcdF (DUF218 family)
MTCEKPVALIHSYLKDRQGKERPDRLTRVGILAAAEMYRRGEISKICVTVVPELSNLIAGRLKKLITIPEEDLIIQPETVSTKGEIKTFRKMAEEAGWSNLLTIGNSTHLTRIKREIGEAFKNSDKNIRTISPEEILDRYSRYEGVMNEMKHWQEQKSFDMQERVLNTPVLGDSLLLLQECFPNIKITLQTWVFKQLEKR